MRYAIYFTPGRDDKLTRAAANWLGRDAFSGETLPVPAAGSLTTAEIVFHTAAARRYGFHATLRAPFRLAEGQSETALVSALDAFCASQETFTVPRMVLGNLSGFFALIPERPSYMLDRLARDVVTTFEPFRAPLNENELQRRNPESLNAAQLKNLYHWGYPYIFEEFRFHMTLTGRITPQERAPVQSAIEDHFGPLLDAPLEIGSIGLFVEPEPGAPFTVRSFHEIGRLPIRKTA